MDKLSKFNGNDGDGDDDEDGAAVVVGNEEDAPSPLFPSCTPPSGCGFGWNCCGWCWSTSREESGGGGCDDDGALSGGGDAGGG